MRKGWELLVVWIGELARLAGHPLAEYRINQNAARALLRRAEALARRMLVIEAMQRPLPRLHPVDARARKALKALASRPVYAPEDVRYKPPAPRTPKLALCEPCFSFPQGRRGRRLGCEPPSSRIEYCGVYQIRMHSTRNEPDTHPTIDPMTRITHRICALRDVCDRKSHHARRMARWIASRRARRRGAISPLRPGRPPGWRPALAARDSRVRLLGEANHIAGRALYPRAGPPG